MISRKTIILLVVSSSIFFEALDIAIVNLAIPLIQKEFALPPDTIQWMQTLYVLFYGGFLILGGKLADVIGRKKVFMAGSALFLFTSFGAGISTSFEMLTAFRSFQGLGAALVMPSALSIITNTFTEPGERNKAIGIFGSFAAIGSGSGLSLGGLIATYMGWQWIFFINVPVILLAIVMGIIYITPDESFKSECKPDILSGALLTAGIIMLTYIIHDLKNIQENYIIHGVLAGAVLLCFRKCLSRIRNSKHPLIDFSLFDKPMTRVGNVVFVLLGAFFTGYLFTISQIMQNSMGLSAARAGVMLFPFSILSAIVSKTFLPAFLKKFSILQGGLLGMLLMTCGGLLLFIASKFQFNYVLVLLSVACVTGAGIAVCFTCLIVICIQEIPAEHHGLASSVANTAYFFGAGLGLSLIGLGLQFNRHDPQQTLPIITLIHYAGIGLGWLWINSLKNHQTFVHKEISS
jgi:predicted MFS family arabinose efflux permease